VPASTSPTAPTCSVGWTPTNCTSSAYAADDLAVVGQRICLSLVMLTAAATGDRPLVRIARLARPSRRRRPGRS
jgi:hypothetical protein